MRRVICLLFLCAIGTAQAAAQELSFNKAAAADPAELAKTMPGLARDVMANYKDDDRERYLNNLFRLQMIAGQYAEANATIKSLRDILKANDPVYAGVTYAQYEIFSKAKLREKAADVPFADAFRQAFREAHTELNDKAAFRVAFSFVYDLPRARSDLQQSLDQLKDKDTISLADALALARKYQPYTVYQTIAPLTESLLAEDENRRYVIQDDVLIKTKGGATLSAIVVRKRGVTAPQPTALFFNIYTDLSLYHAALPKITFP